MNNNIVSNTGIFSMRLRMMIGVGLLAVCALGCFAPAYADSLVLDEKAEGFALSLDRSLAMQMPEKFSLSLGDGTHEAADSRQHLTRPGLEDDRADLSGKLMATLNYRF